MLCKTCHVRRKELFPHLSEKLVAELQGKWGNIPRFVLEKVSSRWCMPV